MFIRTPENVAPFLISVSEQTLEDPENGRALQGLPRSLVEQGAQMLQGKSDAVGVKDQRLSSSGKTRFPFLQNGMDATLGLTADTVHARHLDHDNPHPR